MFDFILNKKQDVYRLIQFNHPKNLFIIVSLIILSYSFSLEMVYFMLSFCGLFCLNIILSKKFNYYDDALLCIETNSLHQMKDFLNIKILNLYYSYYNYENDKEFCSVNLVKYSRSVQKHTKHILNYILKDYYILPEEVKKEINDYSVNLRIEEIMSNSIECVDIIFDILLKNNPAKLKKYLNSLVLKNISQGYLDLVFIYLAKLEYLDNNFAYSSVVLNKVFDKNNLDFILLKQEIENKLTNIDIHLSLDRHSYLIKEDDYKRNSEKDKLFLKKYKMILLEMFNNRCVKSGVMEDIELDHFFIPKSKGGSFLMEQANGKFVLNVVPLNKKINSSKKDKNVIDTFTSEEINNILLKLQELNNKINNNSI